MGKYGSTFFCNLQEDLLVRSGIRSGQKYLRKLLGGRYVEHFHPYNIFLLILINFIFGSIVVKTHTKPTRMIRWLIKHRIAKATYTYRDVRDVILSALDEGARNRRPAASSTRFIDLFSVEDALSFGLDSVNEMQDWVDFWDVHFIRYEDLINDRLKEIKKFLDFLSWQIPENALQDLIQEHDNKKFQTHNFNKGTTKRYQSEMSDSDQRLCKEVFQDFLVKYNYETQ
jgi:hypothetical protein